MTESPASSRVSASSRPTRTVLYSQSVVRYSLLGTYSWPSGMV